MTNVSTLGAVLVEQPLRPPLRLPPRSRSFVADDIPRCLGRLSFGWKDVQAPTATPISRRPRRHIEVTANGKRTWSTCELAGLRR